MAKIKNNEIEEEARKDNLDKDFHKIYIGPDIPKYSLRENSVYVNSFSSQLLEAKKEYPNIEKLVIDVEKINDRNNDYYKNQYLILKKELGGK